MKWAVIQVKEEHEVLPKEEYRSLPPMIIGKSCFNFIGQFDSLQEAESCRSSQVSEDWYIIIQVW